MSKNTKIFLSIISLPIIFSLLAVFLKWMSPDPWIPIPPEYSANAAKEFCIKLAGRFQSLSYFHLILGWTLVSIGSICALLGSILGSAGFDKNNYSWKSIIIGSRGILFVGAGVVFLSLGRHFIDRSDSATTAAAEVNNAISFLGGEGGNRKAYDLCIKARSGWLNERLNHEQLENLSNKVKNSPEK